MKLNRRGLGAVAIVTTLIAILVVSPAIGGPSMKQWIKKRITHEVTRQLQSKTGPSGSPGAPGAPGSPGAGGGGGGIVARASLSGPPVSSAGTFVEVPIPLADASWTQASGELDEVYAEVTHSGLAGTCTAGPDSGQAVILINLPGGQQTGMGVSAGEPAGAAHTVSPTPLMPSLAGTHTLTATIKDSCLGSEDTTVTGLDIYVIAHR